MSRNLNHALNLKGPVVTCWANWSTWGSEWGSLSLNLVTPSWVVGQGSSRHVPQTS